MRLKRHLLLSTAVGLVAIPHPAAAQNAAPVAYSWAGPYLGIAVGDGWGSSAVGCAFTGVADDSPCNPSGAPALHPHGVLGGLEAGYNWQSGNWLLGVEADFNALDISDVGHFGPDANYAPAQLSERYDWLGTARGRAGFAIDRTLFYATGGFAYGHVSQQYTDASFDAGTWRGERIGWTVGGGVQYSLTQNWSVKAEYLYVNLQPSNLTVAFSPTAASTFQFKNNFNILRAGLDYRF